MLRRPLLPVDCTVMIYGSEFKKGTTGMENSLEADDLIFDNKPIILKDRYEVSGSDMAQIGWIEVTTENGATGYLWYLKSEHETRLRFDDYLETAMIEAVPAAPNSGAEAAQPGLYGLLSARSTLVPRESSTLWRLAETSGLAVSRPPSLTSTPSLDVWTSRAPSRRTSSS